jgi:hypothetical protein
MAMQQAATAAWVAAVEGTDDEKRLAFFEAFVALRRRIELLANLPIGSLDKLALQARVREIGKQ